MSIWSTEVKEAPPLTLTLEMLLDTARAILNAPPHPCTLGQHVVSPRALREPGWYPCVNCFQPVDTRR